MSRIGNWFRFIGVAAALLLCPGCGSDETAQTASDAADTARTERVLGPVKVVVEVDPREPRLSDNPTLTLTVEAEEGVDVTMPPFGSSLADFVIRNYRKPLPEMRGRHRVIRQIYELEPVRTGEHLIHPITVPFVDNRPNGDGKEHVAETEGLTIVIQSVLGEEIPSLAELKPAEAPKALPEEPFNPLGLLWALPVVVVPILFVWLRRRRSRSEKKAPRLTPRELAWLELKDLLAAGYLEREEFNFYYRDLTAVVCRYIERTTGVRAYEQTTQEFLHEVSNQDTFPADERERLRSFLEAADLVKFAALRPGKTEIESSFNRAKDFLGLEVSGSGEVRS